MAYGRSDEIKGIYRHYKGGLYRVLAVAHHSETNEALTIYVSEETGQIWARPADAFFGEVEVDGQRRQRFQRLQR